MRCVPALGWYVGAGADNRKCYTLTLATIATLPSVHLPTAPTLTRTGTPRSQGDIAHYTEP